jgi:hypothetical protein
MTSPSPRGASLIGREHVRVGRNNQDGFSLRTSSARTVGVVTDGCSSQARSEVGAQLGAQFLSGWLSREPLSTELPLRATDALCAWLYRTAVELDDAQALDAVLDTYFLFTFLAVVREGPRALVFGMGDGALLVDDQVVRLDSGPQNAPEYCAYRLGTGRRPEPQLHFVGEAKTVALMSDGLDCLLAREPGRVRSLFDGDLTNPLTLQRRLNVLGEAERFADDATLVLVGA